MYEDETMPERKRVVVAGATGTIGKALCRELIARGYDLVVFSRHPENARHVVPGAVEYVAWQAEERGPWMAAIEGAYGVINLVGAPFFVRWTEEMKRCASCSTSSKLFYEAGVPGKEAIS
jgi:uncharacterized protein